MKNLCNLQVDVMVMDNGNFDIYINNEGDSGCHYTNVTADKIGQIVAEEVEIRCENKEEARK